MDRFRVEVISQHPNPQQTIYAAMHQDYAEAFVWDQRNEWPSEEKAGELIIRNLLKGGRGHFGPLEHPQIVLNCGFFPHSTMQQIRTHRVGLSFDVQCLSGDTEITFVHASGGLKKYRISELYDLWENGEKAVRERKVKGRNGEPRGLYRRDCKKRLRKMKLRVLNEDTGFFETSALKSVMCSGKQPVYRLTLADGKTLDCTANHRLFTAKGWQRMGEAVGLVADADYTALAMSRRCQVMCNGTVLSVALYAQKAWLTAQAQKGLHANAIAQLCDASPDVIRYWAKKHSLSLPSGHHQWSKTVVGSGIYREQRWLESQLSNGKNVAQMAKAASCSIETIKKWVYHYNLSLNKRSPGTQNPWNKGFKGYNLDSTPESRETRRENAAKYTQRGEDSVFWKGGVSTDRTLIGAWTRQTAPQVHKQFDYICQHCGERGGALHAHHLVPVFADINLAYEFKNLVSVCKSCHTKIHSQNLELEFAKNFQPITEPAQWKEKPVPAGRKLAAHAVEIIKVEFLGFQTTYDLEVEEPWHNFVANGLVVHNSFRYTGSRILDVVNGKTDVEDVFYLRPVGAYSDRQGKKYDYTEALRQEDLDWCRQGCAHYKTRIDQGFSEEHARGLIPFDVRQHWVLSANARSLMHLLDLRWKADAQLEAQKLCEAIWPHFQAWVPAVADWYETTRLKKARLSP
ncbi:MAG: FAD-dependent thymidylate synthase [Leptolyngbya foveolarum]|uniref:FAD-dependent thymidylate synthase n=1 Tax=Leptolyngbya foveolarum TaxID=47253 RepID=A0A2W4UH15_9CYAN|nr:MAG: FAD-dependent thymidylate synthase [Leptolyngbya foveolarum]